MAARRRWIIPAGHHVVLPVQLCGAGKRPERNGLHAINVWLLYELALVIFRRAGPALFAAALWAVHPIGTEAITIITWRTDRLAAMAVLYLPVEHRIKK